MTCVDLAVIVDAYVDRELPFEEMAAADAHVAGCIGCRAVIDDRLALGRLVRTLPYHAAPPALKAEVVRRARVRAPMLGVPRSVLAAAAALLVAVSIGGSALEVARLQQQRADNRVAESIVDAHVAALRSDRLIDVRSTDQHTVKPWFLGKLDFSPPVADLASVGFPLTGGRVDAVDGREAAVLVYHRRLHPIALFIWPASARDRGAPLRTIRGFQTERWIASDMSFWVVSDLNADELNAFVDALQRQAR